MALTAEGVVGLFERDAGARKRLAELLVSEPDVRLAIINAVLRDVATKADLEALGRALREEMRELKADLLAEMDRRSGDVDKRFEMFDKRLGDFDKRLGDLHKGLDVTNERISDLNRIVAASFVGIVATLVATILLRFLP